MVGTCIEKLYKGKKIVGYKVKLSDGNIHSVESKELKTMIQKGLIHVDNLKFTQDGKLIDMKIPWQYSEKMINASEELGKARESLIEKIILITDRVAVCNFKHARTSSLGDGYADTFYLRFDDLINRQIDIMGDFIRYTLKVSPQSIFKDNPYGADLGGGSLKCVISVSKENSNKLNICCYRFKFNTIATFTSREDTNKILDEDELNRKIIASILYTSKELMNGNIVENDVNNIISWLDAIIIYKEIVSHKLDLNTICKLKYLEELNKHILDTISILDNTVNINLISRILQSANL